MATVRDTGCYFCNGTVKNVTIIACISKPYGVIGGELSVNKNSESYEITCKDRILSNCVNASRNHSSILLVKQPPFVFLPVNITTEWYQDPSVIILQKINQAFKSGQTICWDVNDWNCCTYYFDSLHCNVCNISYIKCANCILC